MMNPATAIVLNFLERRKIPINPTIQILKETVYDAKPTFSFSGTWNALVETALDSVDWGALEYYFNNLDLFKEVRNEQTKH